MLHKHVGDRRGFLKTGIGLATAAIACLSPSLLPFRWVFAWAAKRVILPQGTNLETLKDRNPAHLDTRNLELTPLEDFGTMGLSDHQVDLAEWRLEVGGKAKTPLRLSYAQLQRLPSVERNVLLICPGFFANHGRWRGIAMPALLEMARAEPGITHVRFSGPKGPYEKVEQFPVEDVLSNKVFLSYGVNGQDLPIKNGFPLRVVAEDYYGYTWVKYVFRMELMKVERGT
jgi:DMSO/TMAO reductase YedYZ molybdopterin-dependent catalytic subunit